jgi:glycosyltransferase involved in cell wall biosynthesis
MVLIEAMACGVPCVYDCPCGPSEIISNNEDGFIENGNTNAGDKLVPVN